MRPAAQAGQLRSKNRVRAHREKCCRAELRGGIGGVPDLTLGLLLMSLARRRPHEAPARIERMAQHGGYTGFGSGLVPRKTANARSMKPTPARISATPTTIAKIETPVAM